MKLFKDWASARNHHSSSTIKMVPNDILFTDTTMQLLEIVIHHGVINHLAGGRLLPLLRERLEDWPFCVDSRLGINCKSATDNPRIQ